MNRVLIVYGTTEGHTRKVCEAIAATLERMSVGTDVIDARENPDPVAYDGIIVAASVHIGHYQKSVIRWIRGRAAEFGDRPTIFVSISLTAAGLARNPHAAGQLEAVVEGFREATGWWPHKVAHVAGALLYTRYNFMIRWIMRRIAGSQGGDIDVTKDYDYTDWNAVRILASEFGRQLLAAA